MAALSRVTLASAGFFVAFCGRYIFFRNFIHETKIITSEYVVPNGFSSTLKQMTLNDLELPFFVKYCFPSGIVKRGCSGLKA